MNLNPPTASHRISQGFTRLDCAKRQVTGIRYDPIINQYEIWVFGTLKREVPAEGGRESPQTGPRHSGQRTMPPSHINWPWSWPPSNDRPPGPRIEDPA